MNHEKFIAIRDYFARIDEERKRTQTFSGWTGVGMFVPSSLTHLYAGFQHLINTGAIDQQGLLLDAGCGDGRVLALLAGVFNIPCFGIEYSQQLVETGERYLAELRERSLFKGAVPRFVQGNFCHDETYVRAGVRFQDIKTIFNFVSCVDDVTALVASKSPIGTKVVVYGTPQISERFDLLTLEHKIELVDATTMIRAIKLYVDATGSFRHEDRGHVPSVDSMYVYKK